jgi:hypothetical protein
LCWASLWRKSNTSNTSMSLPLYSSW